MHGDFQPNNLLICIWITTGPDGKSCIIQTCPDNPCFPYLKVIYFDWAGDALYPLNRNPDVAWPGEDGMAISLMDDEKMISSWLEHWPGQAPVPVSIPDQEERGDNIVTLQICQV